MRLYQVERHLEDSMMERMDHALGRPVDPENPAHSMRNHFATDSDLEGAEFLASGLWDKGRSIGDMTWYHVNAAGRAALAAHLRQNGDETRLFAVTRKLPDGESYTVNVAAASRGSARYRLWLDADVATGCFGDFCKSLSVKLAHIEEHKAA